MLLQNVCDGKDDWQCGIGGRVDKGSIEQASRVHWVQSVCGIVRRVRNPKVMERAIVHFVDVVTQSKSRRRRLHRSETISAASASGDRRGWIENSRNH